jgi:hypothetical protein
MTDYSFSLDQSRSTMDSQLSNSGSLHGDSEALSNDNHDAILNENLFDVAAELHLPPESQSESGRLVHHQLSNSNSSVDTTSNATCSDSSSVGSEDAPDQIPTTPAQAVYPIQAIEYTLGLDRLPCWTGRIWPEKQDQCVNLEIFHRHYLQSLWLKFFHTLNPRNIHRCIHDHFIGGDYNIQLPDCHPESDIEVIDRVTITKPPQYRRTKLKSFVTSYYQHIKPPTLHLANPPTREERRQTVLESRSRRRIQIEMYGEDNGEHK